MHAMYKYIDLYLSQPLLQYGASFTDLEAFGHLSKDLNLGPPAPPCVMAEPVNIYNRTASGLTYSF